MAHAAARGLPQPDFEVIAQSHRDLASELTKCGNIPAFDAGRAILAAIQEVKDEISGLKNQLKATDINHMARLANSQIISPTNQLHPLYGISTALQIPHFPQSPEALADLDDATISSILRALGADTSGRIEVKKQKLRIYIGLKPIPV